MHLAYDLLEGYDALVLVDAIPGAGEPGEVTVLEVKMEVTPGEWVLIHMGFALERIDEDKATEAMSGLEMMGRGRDLESLDG
jgi:hydrogenase expression/formation protein HypC